MFRRCTFFLLLLLPASAWAQNGKIAGKITDRATGEPLPGATVLVEGTTRGAAADMNGEYVILDVAPGSYALRASFVGYGTQLVQDVQVSSDFTTVVDFALAPGVELEEVIVQGQRLIRQDEVSTTTVLTAEDIQNLPVNNFSDAMTLAAGMVESQSGDNQGVHLRGGRSGEISYIVDGVLVEDAYSGTLGGFDVARQSINELQVLTGGFSAKYGKAMSGVVLINTPTGGSDFRGTLRVQTDGYSLEGLGAGGPSADYTRPFSNDWGTRMAEASLSGPLLGDRLTFFINADRLDSDTYLSEFDGPVRPVVLPWSQLVGHTFMRTTTSSFVDASGQNIEVDFDALGLTAGEVITEADIAALRDAGVDVDRLGKAAIRDYQMHHQMGLYNDRTRLTTNLGLKLTRDIDAVVGYKLTRRDYRPYDHEYKFTPEYASKYKRNIDLFNAKFTHRILPNVFYEVRGSYASNRYFQYVYEEQFDADDPLRFARVFQENAVIGAFDTEGLSDAEGGSNYDFAGFTNVSIYASFPRLLEGDLGRPFRVSRNLDLDADGQVDLYRGDRLSSETVEALRSLFETASDEELAARGLNRGFIPIMAPPTENDYEERRLKDFQIAFDLTAQVNDRNMLSGGVEFRSLDIRNYFVFANARWDGSTDPSDPNTLTIRPEDEFFVDARPFELAAYIEDKIEFSNLVIRPGLRLDLLDPAMSTVVDYGVGGPVRRGLAESEPASVKWRISPRLGIAFPITDRARLSFNYGQFLQYPEYSRLYESIRTNTWVPGSGYMPIEEFGYDLGFETFVGNPDVDPERTIFYQFDGEFLVSETFKLGASLFYKDIYDYVSYIRKLDEGGKGFWVLDNLDYANARGVEFRAEKRLVKYIGFTGSYTYSRAIGNADDFQGAFNDWYNNSVTGTQPPKGAKPLDWDQPHTLSFAVFSQIGDFSGNLIGRFGSGLPYTPTNSRGVPEGDKNEARRPWTGAVDAQLSYNFDLRGNGYVKPFVEVTNLLDRRNVLDVFPDTGAPAYTLDPGTQFEDAHRPYYIGPPRHVQVGIQLGF